MDEELKKQIATVNRLTEEIKEEGRKAELAKIRFAHFQVYAAGQHDAWRAVLNVIRRLKGELVEAEEDAKPDDPH